MLMTAQAFSQVSLPVLQGVVSRLGTNEPVARATVELRKPGGDPKPYTLATTDEGKFVFRNIPAGQYELAVTRPGYVPFVYGRRKASGPGEPITLPSTEALSLKLRTSSVSRWPMQKWRH
jgi:hypothetical protein